MDIKKLQKLREENNIEIFKFTLKEHARLEKGLDKYAFSSDYCEFEEDIVDRAKKAIHSLNALEERLALEFIIKEKVYVDCLKEITSYKLRPYAYLWELVIGGYGSKTNFESACRMSSYEKYIILPDEKYLQQKEVSKFNISHLGIKLSSRFRPKCLKRLALKPFAKLNSEVCYKLSLLLYKPKHLNKKLEYLKMGAYKSDCNCVNALAEHYKNVGDKEKQIETLRYGASYNFLQAKQLVELLLETKVEENIKEAIGVLLYYHADFYREAREILIDIFSTDDYGKKDLDAALLLHYTIYENPNIEEFKIKNRDYFISKTDEAIEEFTQIQKEYDKIWKEICKQEKLEEERREAERIKREAESMKRRASNVAVSHDSSYYDLSNLDELLADVQKDSILMSRLVTIYLENNLKFDSKFVNVIINNCHGWMHNWAEVMRAILFKYGYVKSLQIKEGPAKDAKLRKYTPKDVFETFKRNADKNHSAIYVIRARYELAKCYAEGYGTAKDSEKAKEYFAKVNSRYTNLFTSAQKDRQTILAKKEASASAKTLAMKNKDVKGMLECYQDDNEIIFKVIDIYLKDKLPLDNELANCVLDYKEYGKSSSVINFMVALLYRYGYINDSKIKDYSTVTAYYAFEENALRGDGLIKTRARYELAKCYEEGYSVEKNIDKAIGHYELCDKAYAKKLQDKHGTKKVVEQIPEKTKIENFVTSAYERFLQEYPEKGKIVEYRTNRFFLNDVDIKFIYELLNNGYQMYYLFNEKGDYIGSSYLGVKGIKDFASVKSEIDKKDRLERERKLEQQKKLEQQQLEAQRLEQQRKLDEQKRLEQQRKLEQEQLKKEQTKKVATSSVNNTSKTSVASTSNNVTSKQNTTTTSAQNTTTSTKVNTSKNVNLSTSGANAKLNEVRKKYGYIEEPTGMPSVDENGNEITSIAKRQKLYSKQLDAYYKSQGVYEKNIFNAVKESSNRKCNQIAEKVLFAINDSKPIHDEYDFASDIRHNYKKQIDLYKQNYVSGFSSLEDIKVNVIEIKCTNSKGQAMNDVWVVERELAGLPVYADVTIEVEVQDRSLALKSNIDYTKELYNANLAFDKSELSKFSTFGEFMSKTEAGTGMVERSRQDRNTAIAQVKDVYKQVIKKVVSDTFKQYHIVVRPKVAVSNNIIPCYVLNYKLRYKWQEQY